MLDRIEAAYLAAMRVIVLVAATLALIIVGLGAIAAAPKVVQLLGFGESAPQVGAINLATFIEEQRAAGREADGGPARPEIITIPGKVAKAADLLTAYLTKTTGDQFNRDELREILAQQRDEIDVEFQPAYEDSLLRLTEDLSASTGRPLSVSRVGELLDWHSQEFLQEVEQKKIEAEAEEARSMAGLAAVAAGLVAFLLILFFFLFVKIERNLRLVNVREMTRS